MRKNTPINSALEVLEIHQEKTEDVKEYFTPPALIHTRERFRRAMETKTPVLIENSELSSAQSVVIEIAYVSGRWCLGYQTVVHYGEELKIPHTIHYTDVYGNTEARKSSRQVRIIFKGENPFG